MPRDMLEPSAAGESRQVASLVRHVHIGATFMITSPSRPKKTLRMGTFGSLLVLLAALPLGCPDGNPVPDGGAGGEWTLKPSTEAQRVEVSDALAVIVPAGLLTSDTVLTVGAPEAPPPDELPNIWSTFAGYSIRLGDLHELSDELTIEMKYDPALIAANVAPENAFAAGYWDTDQDTFVSLPFTIDTDRQVIAIRTRHLSDFFGRTLVAYGLLMNDQFQLQYDPVEVNAETGPAIGWYTQGDPLVDPRTSGVPMYAEDVWSDVNRAYQAYVDAGLATAGKPVIQVDVGGSGSPSRGKIRGRVSVTLNCANGYPLLRTTTAHEVFHCVQGREYYTCLGMTTNNWWMDATAEYAAARIAWPGSAMGGDRLTPRYLEKPLNSSESILGESDHPDHQYNTAWFIDFLVKQKGIDFVEMFKAVAASYNPLLTRPLNSYLVGENTSLAECYKDFAAYWLFSSASPVAAQIQASGLASVAIDFGSIGQLPSGNAMTYNWMPRDFPSLTCRLCRIFVGLPDSTPKYTAKLESLVNVTGNGTYAVLYRVPGDDASQAVCVGEIDEGGGTPEVEVKNNDVLYLLVVNGNDYPVIPWPLRVTLETKKVTLAASETRAYDGNCFQWGGSQTTPMNASVDLSMTLEYTGDTPTMINCSDATFCYEVSGSTHITGADITATVSYTPPKMTYAADSVCEGNPGEDMNVLSILETNVMYRANDLGVDILPSGTPYHGVTSYLSGGTLNVWTFHADTRLKADRGEVNCGTGGTVWMVTDENVYGCEPLGVTELLKIRIHTKSP